MGLYEQSLEVLKQALENGIEASLESFTRFMHFLGDPQDDCPAVQIAGTNGKSSTSRYTAAILKASGMSTGLYLSPELMFYPERLELDGAVVADELFGQLIIETNDLATAAIEAGVIDFITEFEILTAAAFRLFSQAKVDWAVLEVGLGGRWDATSVVNPKVAVVTGIDLDHTHILGDTVEAIAAEKAAIIKPGSFAVLGPGTKDTRQVFIDQIAEAGVKHMVIEPPYMPFRYIGANYQKINIATAWVAAEAALGRAIDPETVQQALDGLIVPGRFEVLRAEPLLMIDATHNPQAARFLLDALIEHYGFEKDTQGKRRIKGFDTLVLGILADKDATGIIQTLTPWFENLAATQSASPRSIPADELANLIEAVDGRRPVVYGTVAEAVEAVTAQSARALVTGSITVAGEGKKAFTQASAG